MRRPVCKTFTSHYIFLLISKQQAQLRSLQQTVGGYWRLAMSCRSLYRDYCSANKYDSSLQASATTVFSRARVVTWF